MKHWKLLIQAGCAAAVIAILFAGLWPFELSPPNQVRWLRDRNGLRISSPGILYSQEKVTFDSGSFSIEVLIEPALARTRGIGVLLEIFGDGDSSQLSLGQWNSYLILRGPGRKKRRRKGYFEIGLESVFHEGIVRYLAITSGTEGVSIYVNGELMKFTPEYQFTGNSGSLNSYLILGNSSTGDNQWHGKILRLSLDDRMLTAKEVRASYLTQMGEGTSRTRSEDPLYDYRFNEHEGSIVRNSNDKGGNLLVPDTFTVLRKQVLIPPWTNFKLNRSYLMDAVINLLGFLPLGFFLALYLASVKRSGKGTVYVVAAVSGAAISLFIEIVQVFIPVRSSSSTDLIFNILGTIIGIHLVFLIRERLPLV